MIKLRKLNYKDIDGMLEWMRDIDIAKNFRFDAKNKSKADIEKFIDNSFCYDEQHFAIVNMNNEYLGTISLKNIDLNNKKAEYAICLRKKAIGTGIAREATEKLFEYAYNHLHLHKIYLNVFEENERANQFYKKIGFVLEGKTKDSLLINGKFKNLNWYSKILDQTILNLYFKVNLQRNINEDGELIIFEGNKEIPFDIKRMFYIKNVKLNEVRGKHANKRSSFIMICVTGSVKIRVSDGKRDEIIELDETSEGLYIPKMIWKDMYDFSSNCVLMILSDEYYDDSEYIRDFGVYKHLMEKY